MQFVKIPLQNFAQRHIQPLRRLRQVPRDVAKLLFQLLLIQRMPLKAVLFEQINRFAALAAKPHQRVFQHILRIQRWIKQGHGFLLIIIDIHCACSFCCMSSSPILPVICSGVSTIRHRRLANCAYSTSAADSSG